MKFVASAIITLGLLFALKQGGLRFIPDGGNFDHVRWWTLPAYFVTLVAMSYFRAVRWRYLLRSFADVPTRKILSVSWIGFAAILLMPLRIGEFVRPYMIRSPGRTDSTGRTVSAVTMSAATGTIVAERVIDGLYVSIVLAIALLTVPHLEPLPKAVVGMPVMSVAQFRDGGYAMLGLFIVAFIVIAVYYLARDFARRATLAVFGLVSRPLAEKLASMAENMADGLRFLSRGRDALPFLGETTLYWALNAGGMMLLAWGCGVVHADGTGPTYGEACALMGTVSVMILIPGPPGMLGTFQAGLFGGMSMFFPASTIMGEGAAFVFVLYIIQFVWQILGALLFLIGDRAALRALEEAEGILPPHELAPAEKLATPDTAR
jgi:glycosyltransferase 2 family protein